jgi:succinyl-diaminopimelate desuccinylase
MRALKERGVVPKKKIVLILGCDEESGWECMDHYKKKYAMPLMGFTPDAEFPLINCEKGIFQSKYELPLPKDSKVEIIALSGGDRLNVVPDTARLEARTGNASFKTTAQGVRSHGSTPELGKNALWTVFKNLLSVYERAGEASPFKGFYEAFCLDTDGSGAGINMSDEESGALSVNLGLAEVAEGKLTVGIDIRYPVTKKQADIELLLEGKLRALFGEAKKIFEKSQLPHFVPKDTPLVKTLLAAYEAVVGQSGYPVSTGGGTYAKAMDNCVAFGPTFPGQAHLEHRANEYISVKNLLTIAEIISEAIERLLAL